MVEKLVECNCENSRIVIAIVTIILHLFVNNDYVYFPYSNVTCKYQRAIKNHVKIVGGAGYN